MNDSKNKKVQTFLDDLNTLDPDKFNILQALRKVVLGIQPKVSERMMYGGIMFSLDQDFGGLFVSKHHVSFEFSQGYQFKDPDKHLEGTGKFRRHLKLESLEDITEKTADSFVKQAIEKQSK